MVRRPTLDPLTDTTRAHRVASCEKGPMRTHQCPYCHDNFTPSRAVAEDTVAKARSNGRANSRGGDGSGQSDRPDQGVCSGATLTVLQAKHPLGAVDFRRTGRHGFGTAGKLVGLAPDPSSVTVRRTTVPPRRARSVQSETLQQELRRVDRCQRTFVVWS